jgi:hypothetical protein
MAPTATTMKAIAAETASISFAGIGMALSQQSVEQQGRQK